MELEFPDLPDDPELLERQISDRENAVKDLKPETRARIIWADPENKAPTRYSLVYLHGFTASQGEGFPVHVDFAKRYGLNLYLSRLKGHGIDDPDAFKGLTPQHLIDSAVEAVSTGRKLGNKVILMGTSTGASLALYLASKIKEDDLHGLILYSPLIDFYGIKSLLLSNKWSRSILKIVPGKQYVVNFKIGHPDEKKIWYTSYRLEGALALGKLIEETMTTKIFAKITQPVFTGYYYRNEKQQDTVVSVSGIKKMYDNLGTGSNYKKIANFPKANTHVICNFLLSKSVNDVKQQTFRFSEKILGLNPLG